MSSEFSPPATPCTPYSMMSMLNPLGFLLRISATAAAGKISQKINRTVLLLPEILAQYVTQ